jgi:hypothetical protein
VDFSLANPIPGTRILQLRQRPHQIHVNSKLPLHERTQCTDDVPVDGIKNGGVVHCPAPVQVVLDSWTLVDEMIQMRGSRAYDCQTVKEGNELYAIKDQMA